MYQLEIKGGKIKKFSTYSEAIEEMEKEVPGLLWKRVGMTEWFGMEPTSLRDQLDFSSGFFRFEYHDPRIKAKITYLY